MNTNQLYDKQTKKQYCGFVIFTNTNVIR